MFCFVGALVNNCLSLLMKLCSKEKFSAMLKSSIQTSKAQLLYPLGRNRSYLQHHFHFSSNHQNFGKTVLTDDDAKRCQISLVSIFNP